MYKKEKIQEFLPEFEKILNRSGNIMISTHMNPDDDAISSVLSMHYTLTQRYREKNINILITGKKVDRWSYFADFDYISFVDDIADYCSDKDLIIFVDGNELHRFTNKVEDMQKCVAVKVCIDHHATDHPSVDLELVIPQATSTAEVIYSLFYHEKDSLDPRLAEIFILGIIGDTGTFQFVKPYQAGIFDIVKNLVIKGQISIDELKSKYQPYSKETFELMRILMNNARFKNIKGYPEFMVTHIDRKDIKGYTDEEVNSATSIFHMFTRAIKDVKWGIIFYPLHKGDVKASGRSLPSGVNVREIMEKLGIGGGHDQAAGGTFRASNGESLEAKDCIKEFCNNLEKM